MGRRDHLVTDFGIQIRHYKILHKKNLTMFIFPSKVIIKGFNNISPSTEQGRTFGGAQGKQELFTNDVLKLTKE